jgi:large subunit ribosomal protein L9
MKNVNVLLRENVQDLGQIGDVVRVRPGYARNYLFPLKLAVDATPENVRSMERKRVRVEAEEQAREAQISARIEALGNITLSVVEKADASGTLYGSVGPATIVKLLAKAGVQAEEKDIRLEEPIKSVGTHEIPIHIWGEHYAGIQIVVEAEAG